MPGSGFLSPTWPGSRERRLWGEGVELPPGMLCSCTAVFGEAMPSMSPTLPMDSGLLPLREHQDSGLQDSGSPPASQLQLPRGHRGSGIQPPGGRQGLGLQPHALLASAPWRVTGIRALAAGPRSPLERARGPTVENRCSVALRGLPI